MVLGGGGEAAEPLQGEPEVVVDLGPRRRPQRLLQLVDRPSGLAPLEIGPPAPLGPEGGDPLGGERVVDRIGRRGGRRQAPGQLQLGRRRLGVAAAAEEVGEQAVGFAEPGRGLDRPSRPGEGGVEVAPGRRQPGETQLGVGESGVELRGAAVSGGGAVGLAGRRQGVAVAHQQGGVVRGQGAGPVEGGEGGGGLRRRQAGQRQRLVVGPAEVAGGELGRPPVAGQRLAGEAVDVEAHRQLAPGVGGAGIGEDVAAGGADLGRHRRLGAGEVGERRRFGGRLLAERRRERRRRG